MVISLAQVKQYTTLTDADNADITAMLPVIDAKVKMITRNRWNYQIVGDTVSGSPYVKLQSLYTYAGIDRLGINNPCWREDLQEYIEVGMQISGPGIPSGSYIQEVYYNGEAVTLGGTVYAVPVVEMNQNATATASGIQGFLGLPIAYLPTVAKGVQWLIAQTKSSAYPQGGFTSRSMGPMSWSVGGSDADIDGVSGMPSWFVKGLPRYQRAY